MYDKYGFASEDAMDLEEGNSLVNQAAKLQKRSEEIKVGLQSFYKTQTQQQIYKTKQNHLKTGFMWELANTKFKMYLLKGEVQ